jgi:hypothetical protein
MFTLSSTAQHISAYFAVIMWIKTAGQIKAHDGA